MPLPVFTIGHSVAQRSPAGGTRENQADTLLRPARGLRLREIEGHLFCFDEVQLAEAGHVEEARIACEPEDSAPAYLATQQSAAR